MGHRHRPADLGPPVCCGPRIAAVVIYLYAGQFLSKKRAAQALAELFGVPLSSGTRASGSKLGLLGDPVVGFVTSFRRLRGGRW